MRVFTVYNFIRKVCIEVKNDQPWVMPEAFLCSFLYEQKFFFCRALIDLTPPL